MVTEQDGPVDREATQGELEVPGGEGPVDCDPIPRLEGETDQRHLFAADQYGQAAIGGRGLGRRHHSGEAVLDDRDRGAAMGFGPQPPPAPVRQLAQPGDVEDGHRGRRRGGQHQGNGRTAGRRPERFQPVPAELPGAGQLGPQVGCLIGP